MRLTEPPSAGTARPRSSRARPGSRKALCPNEWVRPSCRPPSRWWSTISTMAGRCRSDRKPAPGCQSCLTSTAIPGSSPASGRSALTHLWQPWRRSRGRAGLEDGQIQDLRHSFASRALALGEGLPMIGKLLGHTQMQTTARYAHLARDTVKASAARIGDSIDSDLGRCVALLRSTG